MTKNNPGDRHQAWHQYGVAVLSMVALAGLGGCAVHVAPSADPHALPPPQVDGYDGYTARQLDSVEPDPVMPLAEAPTLPAAAATNPEEMPVFGSAELPAGQAQLSLEQVYRMALDNDPTLRSAYNELQAVGYGTRAARAGLLPTIGAEASYANVQENVVQTDNPVYQMGQASWTEEGYSLSLTQPIFDWALWQKWRQAQAAERKEVATFAFEQQELMLRVASAYLNVLAAQDQITLSAAEREATRKQLELVEALYQAGQITSVDLSEVKARLDVQEANYLLSESSLDDRRQALLEIIGRADVQLQPLRGAVRLIAPEPANVQSWVAQALEQNWSIRMSEAAVQVARKELDVQRAGHYPTVTLKASTGQNKAGGSLYGGGSTVDDTRVMVNLKVPLYQGGYVTAMSNAAANRLASAEMQLSLARRKAQRQVLTSYRGIVVGMDRVAALRRSVESFQQALELKQEGYQAGLNDIVSVLDASRNLYNAQRQEAEARYNYLLDTLKLKQAAGTLSEEDIVAISTSM